MNRTAPSSILLLTLVGIPSPGHAAGEAATYRGLAPVVHFDVSPPLRDLPPAPATGSVGGLLVDPPSFPSGPLGPQDADPLVQDSTGGAEGPGIPAPTVSFDGPPNVFVTVTPPDPVGDVGPNHYVAMSNLSFGVYDKTGMLLLGPLPNNTLWSGFGGDCETDNSGDPIVIYDQLADRWLLSQFTASGPTFFNCVALSTSPDPTGTYFRWAFATGTNFPDYPKYGMWPNAIFISSREFAGGPGGPFAGMGAYAVNRAQMIAGNPTPQVISFLLTTAGAGGMFNIGDGLLPADLDGLTLPPADNPHYWVGSMDDGHPTYGAPQDALNVWHFNVDFVTPANSTFTLEDALAIAPYDTIFPCTPGSRDCIPQPGTGQKIDILSYRQRPMWRLAYRNFGSHASMVTNQSVEAGAGIAGMRWWEIRVEAGVTSLFQEGTYAPGLTDGIHRWMGSIAMDSAGNMGFAYSASDGTSTFPSVWYTGRLSSDPAGMMPQGEQSIVDGTGSQTGSPRWGDYTSTNVDPVDDCTFWHVNEWVPTTSAFGWVLRIGAFRFNECGTPDFTMSAAPASQTICAGSDADYTVNVGSIAGFTDGVTLAASGNPAPTTAGFDVNPVTPPGASMLTIGNTGAAPAGPHTITVTGTSTTGPKMRDVELEIFTAVPGAPTPLTPADGAVDVPPRPVFTWSAVADATTYAIEIAVDAGFGAIVDSASGLPSPTYQPPSSLPLATTLFWHAQAENVCGAGAFSGAFSFTTLDATEFRLFAGLDDLTLQAFRIEPASSTALEAFTGVEVGGAAYDPANDRVFFSDGTVLWVWPVGDGTATMLGTVTDALATTVSMEGLAYTGGALYASRVAATGEGEGIYLVNPTTLTANRVIAFANPAATIISGIDADPESGQLYGVNDGTLRGLVTIDPDGTVTVVTDYPPGETDVDGLAIGNGNAYLITDDANDQWAVYNFTAGTYTGTVSSPYTTTEAFAAGAWIGPSAVVFADGFESGDTAQWSSAVP